ncbi:hypothetical protein NUW58_g4944 [Xylaria curta]|uniref:Uncharacterized protein n=1 Tax=Xylaria curta TaxID=42375 RepID=A0ACC1P4W3_9PEZI|nr:hypothetical protein NUW58_g4944 [Xylaria curta]
MTTCGFVRTAAEPDLLFCTDVSHTPSALVRTGSNPSRIVSQPVCQFRRFGTYYGQIASDGGVIRGPVVGGGIAYRWRRDVLYFEMEAAGSVTEYLYIMIYGIFNYADSHKNSAVGLLSPVKTRLHCAAAGRVFAFIFRTLRVRLPPETWHDDAERLDTWVVEYNDTLGGIPVTVRKCK